jgi:diaminopimelate epimerase
MAIDCDHFVKSHALGNDYIVVDLARLSFPLTQEAIRAICHRNFGVGSDGILGLHASRTADFGLRIFNPDGSEAEKSGNGLRIFAKFLHDYGYAHTSSFTVETPGGLVRANLELADGRVGTITVDMGHATFRSDRIPVAGVPRDVVDETLELAGERITFTAVSVGNPHCVVLVDALDEGRIRRLGPLLETHALFPNRINVQFARVVARDEVAILIWERGAGYTLASGSSSCAVAAACVRHGLTDRAIRLTMPGGVLRVSVAEDWSLRMAGPASEVARGTFSADLLAGLHSAARPARPAP